MTFRDLVLERSLSIPKNFKEENKTKVQIKFENDTIDHIKHGIADIFIGLNDKSEQDIIAKLFKEALEKGIIKVNSEAIYKILKTIVTVPNKTDEYLVKKVIDILSEYNHDFNEEYDFYNYNILADVKKINIARYLIKHGASTKKKIEMRGIGPVTISKFRGWKL